LKSITQSCSVSTLNLLVQLLLLLLPLGISQPSATIYMLATPYSLQ
jgi:hypothetical protein